MSKVVNALRIAFAKPSDCKRWSLRRRLGTRLTARGARPTDLGAAVELWMSHHPMFAQSWKTIDRTFCKACANSFAVWASLRANEAMPVLAANKWATVPTTLHFTYCSVPTEQCMSHPQVIANLWEKTRILFQETDEDWPQQISEKSWPHVSWSN